MARIALNARLLIPGKLEGTGLFTHQCYKRFIASRPQDDFLLIFDRTPPVEINYGTNCKSICLMPPARRPWLFDLWFDYAITWKLRFWKADLFISTDGYISRRTNVPQLNVIHDINFEHHPEWLPPRFSNHFRARFPVYARKSTKLCTVSNFSRLDIAETYNINKSDISIIPNAPDSTFSPISDSEKLNSKNEFAKGNSYHVFVGSIHPRKNIHGMLAAHKEYKERGGKSDLVIVGTAMWRDEHIVAEGVHWVGRLEDDELVSAIAGANALLYLPFFEGFGVPVVEAMACGVPVVASDTSSLPEVCGGAAAALVDPNDFEGAAQALLDLENDAVWFKEKSNAGIRRARDFSWDKSAEKFSSIISELLSS